MQTLIVPLDGSPDAERALAPASTLARRTGARVVVLTSEIGGATVDPTTYLLEAAGRAGIDDPEVAVVSDHFAATAVAEAAKHHADPLVCMATHARSGWKRALFSSVAEETIRAVEAPVLLVGPEFAAPGSDPSVIVVCTDGSDAAGAIVPAATSFARALVIPVLVLAVAGPHGGIARSDLERVAAGFATEGVEASAELVDGGDVARAITDAAAARPGAVLALATHGRSGRERISMGSVTMEVVARATGPVLTARP